MDYSFGKEDHMNYESLEGEKVLNIPSLLRDQNFGFQCVYRRTPARRRHSPPSRTPKADVHNICPILKRPADCTRPGPSRLSFAPKQRPKQCVGELEIPGLPRLPGPSFPAYESPPTANRRVHWWGFTTLQDGSRRILPPTGLGHYHSNDLDNLNSANKF